MRTSVLLAVLLMAPSAAAAHDGTGLFPRKPEVEYARWRAKLCEAARNAEIEGQRQSINAAYLRAYEMRRLRLVPSRMIDPTLPVPLPH